MKKIRIKAIASLAIFCTLVLENFAPVFAAGYVDNSEAEEFFNSRYQMNINSIKNTLGSSVTNLIKNPIDKATKDSYYIVIPVIDESRIASITVDGKPIGKNANNQYYFIPTENKEYEIIATDYEGNTQRKIYEEEYVVKQAYAKEGYTISGQLFIYVLPQTNKAVTNFFINDDKVKIEENYDGTYWIYPTENKTFEMNIKYSNNEEESITFVEKRFNLKVEALETKNSKKPYIKVIPNSTKGGIKKAELIDNEGNTINLPDTDNGEYVIEPLLNGKMTIKVTYNDNSDESVEYIENRLVEIKEPEAKFESDWRYNVYFKIDNDNLVSEVTVDGQKIEKNDKNEYYFSPNARKDYTIVAKDIFGHTVTYVYNETEFRSEGELVKVYEIMNPAIYIYPKTGKKVVRATYKGTEINDMLINEGFFYIPKENGRYTFIIEYEDGEKEELSLIEDRFSIKAEEIEIDKDGKKIPAISVIPSSSKGNVEKVEYTLEDGSVLVANKESDGTYTFSVDKNQKIKIKAVYEESTEEITFTETRIAEVKVEETKPEDTKTEEKDTEKPVFRSVKSEKDEDMYMVIVDVTDNVGVKKVTVNETDITDSLKDGVYRFKIAQNGKYVITASDEAGNSAEYEYTETKFEEVEKEEKKPDTEKPVFVSVTSVKVEGEDKYEVSAKITDNVGVTEVKAEDIDITGSLDNGVYRFYIIENGEYEIVAKDAAGNTETYIFKETKFSKENEKENEKENKNENKEENENESKSDEEELPGKVDPYEGTDSMRILPKVDPKDGEDPSRIPIEVKNIYTKPKKETKTEESESNKKLPFTGSELGSFGVVIAAIAVTVISWLKMKRLD